MQKTMICLAKPDVQEWLVWNASILQLLNQHADKFAACSVGLVDEEVTPAHLLKMEYTEHPKDAVVSVWSDNAYSFDNFFQAISKIAEYQAYGVMESAALVREAKVGRTEGMCQIAFIKRPTALEVGDWLHLWLGKHTKVAIETQSTFGYRQNVVAAPLPLNSNSDKENKWPLMDAIVEENFPAIAMTSREAFFDSEGNKEQFEERQQIMMQSCFKFIDFECFDCVPMSEHIVKTF